MTGLASYNLNRVRCEDQQANMVPPVLGPLDFVKVSMSKANASFCAVQMWTRYAVTGVSQPDMRRIKSIVSF